LAVGKAREMEDKNGNRILFVVVSVDRLGRFYLSASTSRFASETDGRMAAVRGNDVFLNLKNEL